MTNWNYADAWEAVAAALPDNLAQIHGERAFTWRQFNQRADNLAADLLACGLQEQAKVAAYLHNEPAYLETYYAAFKIGAVPVNTNYRYGPEEIVYLFDNADAEAVVVDAEFLPLVNAIRERVPKVRRWYAVGAAPGTLPDWCVDYEAVAGRTDGPVNVQGPWGRSGDHLLFLYTGGTTGMPKGVMWRQDDLFNVLGGGGNPLLGVGPAADFEGYRGRIGQVPATRITPCCPLMHGTGQFTSFTSLVFGGCVVLAPGRSFSAPELYDTIQAHGVQIVVIVGDAFARPMLAALDESPGRWDLSSVMVVVSSGVMWSKEVKEGMLRHVPTMALFDSFGSSEAVGMGVSVSTKDAAVQTAKFQLGPTVHVFTDDGRRVEPGSAEPGFVAISGFLPIGYYKDPEKSARTFRTIDGVRYSVPGDYAQVHADGTLTLLGRGSVCINTGGEKVFPEEVEEVLKRHPAVADAVCVGVPDERFGEAIVAMVQSAEPGAGLDGEAIIEHVKGHLARYKAPKFVLPVTTIGRSPSGKVDYKRLTAEARQTLGR